MYCTLAWNSCCSRCVFLSNVEFFEECTKLTIFWIRMGILMQLEMKLRLLTNAMLKENWWWCCYFSSRTSVSFKIFDSLLNARIEWLNFWERWFVSTITLRSACFRMSCLLKIREIVLKFKQKLNIIEIFLFFLNVVLLNSCKLRITLCYRIHEHHFFLEWNLLLLSNFLNKLRNTWGLLHLRRSPIKPTHSLHLSSKGILTF